MAGHFILGPWCRFHLSTVVGKYVISTVGELHSVPKIMALGERTEAELVGMRKYETMVFHAGTKCQNKDCVCGFPVPHDFRELAQDSYDTRGEAQRGHYAMCLKWAKKQ
jgi:hypothetical protein